MYFCNRCNLLNIRTLFIKIACGQMCGEWVNGRRQKIEQLEIQSQMNYRLFSVFFWHMHYLYICEFIKIRLIARFYSSSNASKAKLIFVFKRNHIVDIHWSAWQSHFVKAMEISKSKSSVCSHPPKHLILNQHANSARSSKR